MRNSRAAKPGTPAAPSHELTETSTPIEREFYAFYRTPRGEFTPEGSSPQLTTHPTFTSNVKFMNFYPFSDIETISPRPMLFIAGEKAHSIEFSEDAYRLAAEPRNCISSPEPGMWICMTGQALSPSASSPTSLRKI